MKFICWLLDIPGLSPDMWNGSRIFRLWLDRESAAAASKNGFPLDENLRRKVILRAKLWEKIGSFRGNLYGPTVFDKSPWLHAVKLIYDSSDALDALTVKNHIVREEGNYSAHNLISLQKFAQQLADETNHLEDGPRRAMEVFIAAFNHIPSDIIPTTSPPAGSAIWSTPLDTTPDSTPPTKTSSTASPSSSLLPARANPASASTIHPGAPASTTTTRTGTSASVTRPAATAAYTAAVARPGKPGSASRPRSGKRK